MSPGTGETSGGNRSPAQDSKGDSSMIEQLAQQIRAAFLRGERFHLPALSGPEFAQVMTALRQ